TGDVNRLLKKRDFRRGLHLTQLGYQRRYVHNRQAGRQFLHRLDELILPRDRRGVSSRHYGIELRGRLSARIGSLERRSEEQLFQAIQELIRLGDFLNAELLFALSSGAHLESGPLLVPLISRRDEYSLGCSHIGDQTRGNDN